MRKHTSRLVIFAMALAGSSLPSSGQAETILTMFDNFNLDGVFSSWVSATIDSQANGYSITASGYGSGYKALTPNIDATGETNIELTVSVTGAGSPGSPVSGPIVSLVDADGTFYNYAWYGQPQGTHVLRASLSAPTFTSPGGSVPGLDISKLAFFHLQDDPGAFSGQYTITFQLLRLAGAPAPSIIAQSYDPDTQQFSLTWASLPGKNYTVLYSPDLATAFSALLTDLPSGGSSTSISVTVPSGDAGFLRIQQQ